MRLLAFLFPVLLAAAPQVAPDISLTVKQGEKVTIVSADPTPPAYQWDKDGVALVGQTTSTLIIPSAVFSSAGSYHLTATSSTGAITSNAAVLSVTIPPPPPPPAAATSIWPATALPAVVDEADAYAVELGLKFTTDTAGTITAIRFYKSAKNTGTHTGSIWSSAGLLLATVTFTGETASGWQQMALAKPLAVSAGQTYIVSYHTNVGHYSSSGGYFTKPADNPPLHGLNSLYVYGASAFPKQTWQNTNYWADVVFKADK